MKEKKNVYTEARLLSLKHKSQSLKYGAALIAKYPDRFDIFELFFKDFGTIDEAEDIVKLMTNKKIYYYLIDYSHRYQFADILRKEIIIRIKEEGYFESGEYLKYICKKCYQNNHMQFLRDLGEMTLDNKLKIFWDVFTTYYIERNREKDKIRLFQQIQDNLIITESDFFDFSNYIDIRDIDVEKNPWADPWYASDTLRFYVQMNNL